MNKIILNYKEYDSIEDKKKILEENKRLLKEYLQKNKITYLNPVTYNSPLRHPVYIVQSMYGINSLPRG